MVDFSDIKAYLPYYLTEKSLDKMFEDIDKMVQTGYNNGIYTTALKDEKLIFQGDGLDKMKFVFFPDNNICETKAVVFSNTCDLYQENSRPFPSKITYAPIVRLTDYIEACKEDGYEGKRLDDHIEKIKQQRYTQILFLPEHPNGINQDCIVFLDRINHCDNDSVSRDELEKKRLFTLNNFGLYLFLLKLSIHFTRIREAIDRDEGNIIVFD
jgi:hypothetical protein